MGGALLVAGTHSDAGKSVVAAGLCRALRRRGLTVAPFKAQNMALNSTVTASGAEIGRAQAAQAAAAGAEPEAAMNPILLKPSGERRSQLVLMGRPVRDVDARGYQSLKPRLMPTVLEALDDLRRRFDVVVCEGAGSVAEINLREADLVNLGLARAAGLPVVVVGDIDRGGVFASLYGSLALLAGADQALVCGFLINKFRGDRSVLAPGLERIESLTGRPVLGVLPWQEGAWLDAEDSLALDGPRQEPAAPAGRDTLDVAVVRFRWMSNFTDFDALAAEPGVRVRFTRSPNDVLGADLVVLPGTKATVDDLERLRHDGLDLAVRRRVESGGPLLAICGGYQMLGEAIEDQVESGAGTVAGLGLIRARTRFGPEKVLRRARGEVPAFGGAPVSGFQIHHGRVSAAGEPLIAVPGGAGDGYLAPPIAATSWHGLFECDRFRRACLAWVAEARGREWSPGSLAFAEVRERRLDALGDLVAGHADLDSLVETIESGPRRGLPTLAPGVGAEMPVPELLGGAA